MPARPATPWTTGGALLADHDRLMLTGDALAALAGTFPSTRHLAGGPWDPERVIRETRSAWQAVSASVDPALQELAEEDLVPSLPSTIQTLATLRFLLWLWRPGHSDSDWGGFDLASALACHWDAEHRAAFAAWLAEPLLGETRPWQIAQLVRAAGCTPEAAAARLDGSEA